MHAQRTLICACVLWLVAVISPAGDCRAADWPAFGRDHTRNAVSPETDPPTDWDIETGRNIKWSARLGDGAYGTPCVANGLLWAGGNKRDGASLDTAENAALLNCFDAASGELLYQYESPRLGGGYYHDPVWRGMCSTPLVEGDRLWFVSNRHEVICMNIAALKQQPRGEPEVVWKVDMIEQFGIHPHPPIMWPGRECSIAVSYDGLIFVTTGNGVDESNIRIPAPEAPGLICFDKNTGEDKWQVPTSENVLVAEFASPLVAEMAGRGQVVMPHGDGWVRSYDPPTGRLLWEFDVNEKDSQYSVTGRSPRNYFLSTPVLYEDRIYIASGHEPESGEGEGRLVCIDPTKAGDVSAELAVDVDGAVIPPRRIQNVDTNAGEQAIPNPNSGLIWEFTADDTNDNGKIDFEEEMHRTMAGVAIHNNLLMIPDACGVVHCLDPRNGRPHWNCDTVSWIWGSLLIVDDSVFVASEEGTVILFRLSQDPKEARVDINGWPSHTVEFDMGLPVHAAPIFANGVLYVTTRNTLFAIQQTPPED